MARLELAGLSKEFPGGTQAVHELDLVVEDGELLVLVGPSGCGKSTVLRLVAGLETPSAGQIRIDGRVVNELEPRERDVAMVFQSYALYPHMSVRRNVEFPLRMQRMAAEAVRERVAEAARMLGIEPLLERKPAQLSGGQMQRVALARALVRRPRLFLFDEPLSNVDAKMRGEMRAELARLHATLRATALYVTHDQVEAMTLGTRIAVLHQGRLQQLGQPLEVYERPASTFVASFIGSPPMNLLRGAGADVLRPPGAPAGSVVGFRPHAARLGGPLRARAEIVEELGSETLLHARLQGEGVVLALPPGPAPQRGEELGMTVPVEALHVFDAVSGLRLP
ncbi:MAG: sn-glycerol-3-phosphate ABC transporter ATP-binding protein UgpC [Planctomycetota bacterium]|nr:MAG: sn-glycerol-3-phosphate ABC transporter ATP-binding protein UgpC [Planctomycetota bacterium]